MKNELTTNYDAIFGKFMYHVLESAKLIPQDDFTKHFNKGIKFPTELYVKLSRAQLESVKEYLNKNGTRDINYWFNKTLKEAKECQELKQHYLNILTKQLKDIQYKKWKAMDRYLSFMSLRNSL